MPLEPADAALPRGSRLGVYEIVGPLGAGGMGLVVRAVDTRLGRTVAIKVLYADAAKDGRRLRRLVGEARAASALNHPNIVTVFEMGESPRGPYIVTELVEGETVRETVNRGPLPLSLALDVALQTLAGLSKAHEIGIIHRDLKPENLMISRDGFVKILDFGLAKLARPDSDDREVQRLRSLGVSATEQGMIVGTAGYMSPEQVRGGAVTASSDLFGLSVVLYEMISGQNPFLRDTAADTMSALLRDDPEPPAGASPALAAALKRGLQKDPAERYRSAREMETELKAVRQSVDSGKEQTSAGMPTLRTPEFEPGTSRSRRPDGVFTGRWRWITAAALAVAAAAGVISYRANRSPRMIDSVAVLPFASAEPATQYLSEGMTESLTNNLSQVRGLKVVPRTVAMSFRGQEANLQKVGRDLNVRALLTGRVAKRDDNLIVQTELVEVAGGRQLWGGQYNQKLSDVLTVQDTIATQITEKLQGKLSGEQRSLVARQGTRDSEAYQLYLKGRYSWNRSTESGLRTAIEYFEQAIARDPNYAQAYAGLADSSLLLGTFGLASPRETSPRAEAAARKALALDPELAEAHTSLGFVKFHYEWNWAEAEKEFRRAMTLDPAYATAHHGLALLLLALARFEESRAAFARAQELDPVSLSISADRGLPDLFEGRRDAAIRQFRSTVALDPTYARAHMYLGFASVLSSDHREAVAEFERASELQRLEAEALLIRAYALAASGKKAEALKVMEEFRDLANRQSVSPFHAALVYVFFDDKDEAFSWLERGLQERVPEMVFSKVHPLVRKLASDPRYTNLLRRLGLGEPISRS